MRDDGEHWCHRLYRAKASELVLYGRALGLSHGEAEDVLHDTFVALLALGSLPENPEHYAVRAFRNRALNHRRSLWRRFARELESRRWFEPQTAQDPRESQATRCLESLPSEQREVIVLKIWHGYTFEEIGSLTHVSPHTAAGRYRYGLEKLRRAFDGQPYELEELAGAVPGLLGTAPSVGPG